MKKLLILMLTATACLEAAEECTEEMCTVPKQEVADNDCSSCDYEYHFGRQFGRYVEDPAEEVEQDASWPSRREAFSDSLFRD